MAVQIGSIKYIPGMYEKNDPPVPNRLINISAIWIKN